MKAIGYTKMGPIEGANFIEFETATPTVEAHDILVAVQGVSLNPVDTKVRGRAEPAGQPKILGYDAAGIVKQVGNAVNKFKIGDEVFYAGDVTRSGTNAELHVVDERIVGKKPTSLGFAEAAGMPLTSITFGHFSFCVSKCFRGCGKRFRPKRQNGNGFGGQTATRVRHQVQTMPFGIPHRAEGRRKIPS
jgi:NADPH2:quinone reductase